MSVVPITGMLRGADAIADRAGLDRAEFLRRVMSGEMPVARGKDRELYATKEGIDFWRRLNRPETGRQRVSGVRTSG